MVFSYDTIRYFKMPIIVKPLNANLSHDTETFGSMVQID